MDRILIKIGIITGVAFIIFIYTMAIKKRLLPRLKEYFEDLISKKLRDSRPLAYHLLVNSFRTIYLLLIILIIMITIFLLLYGSCFMLFVPFG